MSDVRSPYKGLVPYTEKDSHYFFGRGAERELVIANLRASALTIVYGPSGVGKSSVLCAGVLSSLTAAARAQTIRGKRPDFIPVYCRDWWDRPNDVVKSSIWQSAISLGFDLSDPKEYGLREMLRELVGRGPTRIFLILDQFEDHLNGFAPGRADFDEDLIAAVNERALRLNVLICLRDDSLARLDHYKGQLESIFDNYLRVDHLTSDAARDAITRPLEVYSLETGAAPIGIEPELVEAVIAQVQTGRVSFGDNLAKLHSGSRKPSVEAPYLQLVMTRIWEEEIFLDSKILRVQTLERLGGSVTIVRSHFERTISALKPADQEVAERVFFHIVTPSGEKVGHTAYDLATLTELSPETVKGVLDLLSSPGIRIIRAIEPHSKGGAPRFQVYHDALSNAIQEWQARRRAERAERQVRLEMEVQRRQQRERERLRNVKQVGVAVALLAIALAAWAIDSRLKKEAAVRSEIIARQEEKNAQVASQLAAKRLEQMKTGIKIRQAAIAGNIDQLESLLSSLGPAPPVRFLASAKPRGGSSFLFSIYPDPADPSTHQMAVVTYVARHRTFLNYFMTAGPDRSFKVSYDGWGCLTSMWAVVEYADVTRPPALTEFDMCRELGWERNKR